MTPCLTADHRANNHLTNAIDICELLLARLARHIRRPDREHVCSLQFAGLRAFTSGCPSFLRFVRMVVGARAEPEVIRPAAPRPVAGMTDVQSLGDRPEAQLPSNARGDDRSLVNLKIATAITFVGCARPHPAPRSALNELPEAFRQWHRDPHSFRRWRLPLPRRNDAEMVEPNEQTPSAFVDQWQREQLATPARTQPRLVLHRGSPRGATPPAISSRAGAHACQPWYRRPA